MTEDNHTSEIPLKRCTACQQELPATTEYFYPKKLGKYGIESWCKECMLRRNRERRRKQYHNDPEYRQQILEQQRQKRQTPEFRKRKNEYEKKRLQDPEKRARNNARYRELNKTPERREALRKYAQQRTSEQRELKRKHTREEARKRRQDPEQRARINKRRQTPEAKEHERKYRLARRQDPEVIERERQCNREWRQKPENKLKAIIKSNRRRARKVALPDTLTPADIDRMMEYWDGRCAVCGRQTGFWTFTALDHWIPLNNSECPGTIPTNMIPLCHGKKGVPIGDPSCNVSKHDKTPETWLIQRFGKCKASQILKQIEAYFEWVRQQNKDSETS